MASLSLRELRKVIKDAQEAYHDEGKPIMSDSRYDKLIDQLEELSPNDPLLKKIGAKPTRGNKVKLPHSMGSLPKVRVGEGGIANWISSNSVRGQITLELSDKLDGISLAYGNNGKYYLYTRGDGSVGVDASKLIPYIKGLGKLPKGSEVRGELTITKADFRKLNASLAKAGKKTFENARNLAAGIANTAGIHTNAKYATFIVHEYVHPKQLLSKTASKLKAAGFNVVTHTVMKNPSVSDIEEYLQYRKDRSITDIDGIVATNITEGKEGDRVAIKGINEIAMGEVKRVEWAISRYNSLKPVVILTKAVRLAGANVTRVTAHNAKMVKTLGIGPGAILSIIRSGEVIPKIEGVVKKVKPSFPPEGTYEWNGVDIVQINPSDSSVNTVKSLQLSNFINVLKINGFKATMMSKLVDGGIDTIQKLLRANVTRLEACGFGPKQAQTLYTELHERLKTISHVELAVASNTFPAGFGIRIMKKILTPEMQKLLFGGKDISTTKLLDMLETIEGIGGITAKQFAKGLPKYKAFLNSSGLTPSIQKKEIVKASKITGKVFCFTGVRDSKLEDLIIKKGAKVGSVNKNTAYLVVKQKGSGSLKEQAAMKLRKQGVDIKIITLDEARSIVERA